MGESTEELLRPWGDSAKGGIVTTFYTDERDRTVIEYSQLHSDVYILLVSGA